MTDIIEEVVVPEVPRVLGKEELFVHIPEVSQNQKGIASYDNQQFNIVDGQVSVKPSYLESFLSEPTESAVSSIDAIVNKLFSVTTSSTLVSVSNLTKLCTGLDYFIGLHNFIKVNDTSWSCLVNGEMVVKTLSEWGLSITSSFTDNSFQLVITSIPSVQALTSATNKVSIFENVSFATNTSDATYSDYNWSSEISLTGVSDSDLAFVIFSADDATSGHFSNICKTSTDKVTIYSKLSGLSGTVTILIIKGD